MIPRRLWGSDNGAGTFGAALAVLISLLLWPSPWWMAAIAFVAAFALSLWSARPFAGDHADPGWIVIDEVAGQWLALAVCSADRWYWMLGAFLLFRLFDIWKPGLVDRVQRLPSGWGVMADDLLAGLLAGGLLLLLRIALPG